MAISENLDLRNFFDTTTVERRNEINHIYNTIFEHDWDTVNRTFRVPDHLRYRPDIIASRVYDEEGFWWVILLANDVVDPFDSFDVGEEVVIPSPSEVFDVIQDYRR